MGVPTAHLVFEPLRYRGGCEPASLLPDHDLEREVEEKVTEFPFQLVVVCGPNGIRDFVCFLEKVRDQALGRLLSVPGAVSPEEANKLQGSVQGTGPEVGHERIIGV